MKHSETTQQQGLSQLYPPQGQPEHLGEEGAASSAATDKASGVSAVTGYDYFAFDGNIFFFIFFLKKISV